MILPPPREPPRLAPPRLGRRTKDIQLLDDASRLIAELGSELDERLRDERQPAERMRLLRETTNRITRTANDAVQAYVRLSRAVDAELASPRGDVSAARAMRARLDAARAEILSVLELASHRYGDGDQVMELPDTDSARSAHG